MDRVIRTFPLVLLSAWMVFAVLTLNSFVAFNAITPHRVEVRRHQR